MSPPLRTLERVAADDPDLNPAQREVLALLGATRAERPVFESSLAAELLQVLVDELAPVAALVPDGDPLFVSKHHLTQIHACEAHALAERAEPFAWSVPRARGKVAHKAIELLLNWQGKPNPADLIDEAIARLTEGVDGLAGWLQTRPEADVAELRSEASQRVTTFMECFPPLKSDWCPVLEPRWRVELADGRIVLSGQVDLTLGRPRGSQASKVLVDLKTGGAHPSHVDDLRFYALLDTIRLGVPPRLLASYYLDSGRAHVEPVSTDVLHAAARRTADGVRRLVELLHGHAVASRQPGSRCRWCPALEECAEGRAHLDEDRG